jgi:hypothetical protein
LVLKGELLLTDLSLTYFKTDLNNGEDSKFFLK